MTSRIELFISHASEDKEEIVRPLAAALRRAGVTVWFDEYTLSAGDSLSRSIDRGLATAQFGLVVLSPHFLRKPWPEYELRGLTAREIAGHGKVLIPLWHGVSQQDILNFSPPLADKFAVVAAGREIDDLVTDVLRAVRPDLADRLSMLRLHLQIMREAADPVMTPPEELTMSPPPPRVVAESHIAIRVLNIVSTMGRAHPRIVGDLITFLTNLYQDLHPEPELREWERMTAVYLLVTNLLPFSDTEREALVELLLALSLGDYEAVTTAPLAAEQVNLTADKWIAISKIVRDERVGFSTDGSAD